ncbi:MAG: bifunctional phosphoribosylaminoimidazolecarboxamide formyltransferase/IMP cyclohydrolase [Acidobacteriota bacterium]
MSVTVRRALISVYNKRGLEAFARGLVEAGCEILSSGGTFHFLRERGIEAIDIATYTGSPEILGGRVKTLHPKIHAGILTRRGLDEDDRGLREVGGGPIDLVVVNFYPFEDAVARDPADVATVIENIDIGGPALVRSAAKNFAHVGVVVDPEDYAVVLGEMKGLSLSTRVRLACKAFQRIHAYDRAIAGYFSRLQVEADHSRYVPADEVLPDTLSLHLTRQAALRYGENPHQRAALYTAGQDIAWHQLQGKEISYNNWRDADSAWKLVREFDAPACAVIKHNNPCGAAEGLNPADTWQRALDCDPVSAFGGIVAFNRTVDADAASRMVDIFLEVVIAPSYDPEALEILGRKKALRLLKVATTFRAPRTELQSLAVGILVQEADALLLNRDRLQVATDRRPSEAEMEDLIFAWKVAKHVKSNAIVIAKDAQAIGIGAGQMNRVDSVRLAVRRSLKPTAGACLASDGFFPFPDNVEEASAAGVAAIIQPGGSVRDAEVIAAANRLGISMVLTGIRHFWH